MEKEIVRDLMPAFTLVKREFVIVEVMLPDVSGEVGGEVSVDSWTGEIENIVCRTFDFWNDQLDLPVVLNANQRAFATDVVRRTLEADSELADAADLYLASATHTRSTFAETMPGGERVLAEYLQTVRQPNSDSMVRIDSPARRFG